ncbi:hypothetical protein BT67DRAFT_439339 [Trichocladium antarcticum]|uniref:Nucleoporin NSP1 n=1 Tax=Trichocladium antarcticum TaxID=1450529 RepID=A0AAN6ZG22_9PEZI|nr:hypothetical protein BT67DRAFT_439339 [Trichocladium antarcticum]
MTFQFGTTTSGAGSGQPGSTPAPPGGLFGATGSAQASIFGNHSSGGKSTPQTGDGATMFGGGPAKGNLFANLGNPGTTTTPSTANKPTGGGLFGKTSATTWGTPTTTGAIFGSANTAPQSGPGTTSAGSGLSGNTVGSSMFGTVQPGAAASGTQATPAKPAVFAGFGLGSTTPAGAPPADVSKPAGSGANLFGGGVSEGSKAAAPSATQGQTGSTTAAGSPNPFGQKAAETPAASGTKSLFGGASGTSNPFGQKAAETPAASGTKPLFGGAPPAAAAPGATTTAPAASSAAPTTTAPAESATPSATPSLFSQPVSTTAPAATTATTPAPATSAPSGLLGGVKPATATPAQDANAKSSTAAGFSASTMGPASQLPRLKNKTMDEIITRWATDLAKYQKEFKEQASKVAEWDRMLVDNGEKIQKLYSGTHEAERASNEIERQLSNVESQQEELTSWLDRYEQDLNELFSKSIGTSEQVAGPDQEREKTYQLAEKLTDRLDDMGKDLTKMIKEINDMSSTLGKGSKPDDPLTQIVRVLNGHLSQLQWIDTNAAALQAKVAAAQKASSNMGNHVSGPETDAAESFYRSYRNGYK